MHETQARRGVRRGAAVLLAMVLALSLGWQRTWADEERQLIPVGKAVGIKLFADGVLVVSVSPVQGTEETRSPAKECGLKEGDILLTFNGEKIRSTEHLQAMLAENGETAAELTVQRDGKTLEVTASPVVCEDGGIRLGAWIRDSMAGVGTLTYYDPAGEPPKPGRPGSAAAGDGPGAAGDHWRHRAGDERQPHFAGRTVGGSCDSCAGGKPGGGIRYLPGEYADHGGISAL